MAGELNDRIQQVLRRYVEDDGEMQAVFRGDPILDALSVDSLTMVHIVSELEKEFGIRFDPETIEDTFKNINTLVAYLAGAAGTDGE